MGARRPHGKRNRVYRFGLAAVKSSTLLILLLTGVNGASAEESRARLETARDLEERLALWQQALGEGRAAEVLDAIDAFGPGADRDARVHNLRGLAHAALGDGPRAVLAYEAGLRLDPGLPELHLNLAIALAGTSMSGRALSEFEQALELDPASIEARLGLGRQLLRLRRHARAAEVLEAAAVDAPEDARIQRALAESYDGAGLTEQALLAWRAVDRLEPSADSARRLGELLRAASADSSRTQFELCLGRDPAATDCAEAAAALALEAGDPAAAERMLGSRIPELTEVGLLNILIAYQRMERADAVEVLLARREPELGAAWGVVALVRRSAARPGAALDAVRRGLALEPRSADLENLLGVLLEDTGERAQAREAWQRALALDPDHAAARENLASTGQAP